MNLFPPPPADAGDGGVLGIVSLAGLEPLFTPQQVAEYLHLSSSAVRKLFIDRANVLKIGRSEARGGRRQYLTLRIPRSAVEAFLRERSR